MMSLSESIVLRLVSLGLGHQVEWDYSLSDIDWKAVIDLAMSHGMDAVAWDGLQALYESRPELAGELDASLGETKYDWFSYILQVEQDYERQWKSFVELDKTFRAEGIRMLVLKGFMLNECYPDPRHRSSCDIDCFLMGEGPVMDESAYERGNQLMEGRGIAVDRKYFKHSSFSFLGTKVENHHFCTSARGSRRWKEFERLLQGLLKEADGFRTVGNTGAVIGPALFNALFMTRHAQVHFLVENGISLRHVCDWGMFLKRYGKELDWVEFMRTCGRFGMNRFAFHLTCLAVRICGDPGIEGLGPISERMDEPEQKMLNDILTIGERAGKDRSRFGIARSILRSTWKFRLFSDESSLRCLWQFVRGYFFDRTPELD